MFAPLNANRCVGLYAYSLVRSGTWFPSFRALRRRGGGLRAYAFAAGGRWRNLVGGNARSFAAHMNSVRDICAALPRTGARVYTLTLLSRVGGEDLSGDMCALSSRVNGAWYSRRFTANRCAVIHIPLPCAQMACDIRVFANGYDGCAFLNCGLVRGIQIPHPFSVSAGAIAFL